MKGPRKAGGNKSFLWMNLMKHLETKIRKGKHQTPKRGSQNSMTKELYDVKERKRSLHKKKREEKLSTASHDIDPSRKGMQHSCRVEPQQKDVEGLKVNNKKKKGGVFPTSRDGREKRKKRGAA